MSIQSINPYNNKVIDRFTINTNHEVDRKINQLQDSFLQWRFTSINVRNDYIHSIINQLKIKKYKYAKQITLEMGKPITESILEIEKCILLCEYYIKNSNKFLKDKIIQSQSGRKFIRFEPLGVIFGIMPWNFPFWQVFRYAIPALISGNTCLLKHAPNVQGCAQSIEKIFSFKSDLYLFQNITIPVKSVSRIISNNKIQAVSLTGSEQAGRSVASQAGSAIKKTVLELGGSDPFIVLKDANLDWCVEAAIKSRFLNNGQSCIAAKRFIVDYNIYDTFIKKIKDKIKNLVVGNPLDEETQIGPLSKQEFVDKLIEQIDDAISLGAKLILGGYQLNKEGSFLAPTLLVDVSTKMRVLKEETFGPLFCIIKSKDDSHAIKLANTSDFGLGCSIWTNNEKNALNLSERINSGSVFINDFTKSDPEMPFGGIKNSGYGRELSEFGIKEFVNVKSIVISKSV